MFFQCTHEVTQVLPFYTARIKKNTHVYYWLPCHALSKQLYRHTYSNKIGIRKIQSRDFNAKNFFFEKFFFWEIRNFLIVGGSNFKTFSRLDQLETFYWCGPIFGTPFDHLLWYVFQSILYMNCYIYLMITVQNTLILSLETIIILLNKQFNYYYKKWFIFLISNILHHLKCFSNFLVFIKVWAEDLQILNQMTYQCATVLPFQLETIAYWQ